MCGYTQYSMEKIKEQIIYMYEINVFQNSSSDIPIKITIERIAKIPSEKEK